MRTIEFTADVIGYNAEVFACRYADYITEQQESNFGNILFTMVAPVSIYNEIKDVAETECIELRISGCNKRRLLVKVEAQDYYESTRSYNIRANVHF